MAQQNKQSQFQQPNPRTTVISVILFMIIAFFVGQQFMNMSTSGSMPTDRLITSEFVQAVEQDRMTKVVYNAGDYTVSGTYYPAITAGSTAADAFNGAFQALNAKMATIKNPETGKALGGVGTSDLSSVTLGSEHKFTSTYAGGSIGELMAAHPNVPYEVQLPSPWASILSTLLPIILIGGLLFFFFNSMQKANNSQMSFGKAKTKKSIEERPDVKFSDVAGVDEAVEEMQEIKDFLANPAKYQSMGAKIPRGCLLVGPPGTGKTLLARAVAGEAGVPFFSISGSDFVEMFVGVGASRVRDLFQQAKEASPSIIFIDEIDAVGRQRGTGLGGGHDEREQTLNQLLVEMDGFEANDSVVLIAATNRADVLDPALLRPGRFDRQIVVDAPDVKGRERILQVHSKDKPLGSDVDLAKVAKLTPGFTGADLSNLMNESALLTARRGKKIITQQEVSESMERVIAGPERKGRVLDERTKHTIAYHESGHALVGHLLPHADPVHKISIISRGRALGYTLSIPKEDKVLNSLGEMRDELAVFMGGRVAEEIFCDDITTGASNDLERATKMARAIVTQYGMSTELGTQVFGQPNHEVFLGRDYGNTQDYSEETARRIDDEVARIMKEAHDRAYDILVSHREQMDLMANVLLERETVEGEACLALLDNTWDEYLKHEDEIIAKKEAEERAARERDEKLADPNWKEEPIEPGDQDPNPPFRAPAAPDAVAPAAPSNDPAAPAPSDASAGQPQSNDEKGDGTAR
ncbi:ATP-dependent zinc metalloprotease FtsH [Paraeggerthella hongkongensis]|uniref:ATP-dependent zinc metalloprotease FtsH n=1 Tax=Paraeggerthella TaxID=651554 RepID=UPI000DF7BC2C|nr:MULTISPECIES: ATP-dependent zinc metalloprotease FtsH [Paraeggerthella]MBU5405664.1 ATP-dependent zinc metalloprotease FtsH [Paraeggerthella hongkongensis]MCD2433511.1 ATP-dependent zinc metalloprotease FtsH [Paraeggerthella hominis]RDB56941.1 cell division protein FtsH [Paraeggerthella hongkongensis]